MSDDVTIAAPAAVARYEALPVSIAMKAYLLLDWFEIAVRHEDAARRARTVDVTHERQASLVTVTAAAHALLGLAGELERSFKNLGDQSVLRAAIAAEPRGAGRDRTPARVNATLALGLGVEPSRWRDPVLHLFETLRNPAVHAKAMASPPVPHPDRQRGNVSRETATYSLESAAAAVGLVCEVMQHLVANPSASPAAEALTPSLARRVEQMLDERQRLARA